MPAIRAFDLCLNAPWAILPDNLEQILAITRSHMDGKTIDIEAVEKQLGR